jgi:hypothetical protein
MEEDVAVNMPVQSCAQVRQFSSQPFTNVVVDLSFRCIETRPLEVVLELPSSSSVQFGQAKTYAGGPLGDRLLLTAQCATLSALEEVVVYNSITCAAGCTEKLWTGLASIRMFGAVRVVSVRHRPVLSLASALWDRRELLTGLERATYSWKALDGSWQELSVTARQIAPLQQIDISVRREQSVARIAALGSNDPEHSVALDALSLLPVLSEHFMPVIVADNTSALVAIAYVPSVDNLLLMLLEAHAYGDDVLDWARVHASVHLSVVEADVRQCKYVARVVSVDAALRVFVGAEKTTTGCLLDLALSPQCHIELPVKLALPGQRVVGVELRAVTPGCRALSDKDDVSVEFAPFMRISQCPAHYFLHADTLACTACDDGERYCPPGQHVSGCLPLIHPSLAKECVACPAPNRSVFANTSRDCDAWLCVDGYYRADGACASCTSLRATGILACKMTGGEKWAACTATANEQCVACPPKPRYSEWTVTATECSTRCRDGYFASGGGCEICATFEEAVGALGVSGGRAAGKSYRFWACNSTAQARAEVCSAGDFSTVQGSYVRDGGAFNEDCALECANNSNTHSVRVNATRGGTAWRARNCATCAVEAWPVTWMGVNLPRTAFEMSTACVATCVAAMMYFEGADARTCLFCPSCAVGQFRSARDNCTACQPCAKTLQGGEFSLAGSYNDARSCGERCPAGSFTADNQTCAPHSVLSCVAGKQYEIAGTHDADAACGTCADCAFAKLKAACTLQKNSECVSCGALDSWSSAWSKTGCELTCRADQGYTKLFRSSGDVCRKCLSCPPGRTLATRPENCSCLACAVGIPSNAIYTTGCAWACPLYHVAREVAGTTICVHTLRPTSNAVNTLRAVSPVSCPQGQRLTSSAAYAVLVCENCSTPIGLLDRDLNATWSWGRACAWQCVWGLQKQVSLGSYKCDSIHYTHRTINASAADTQNGGMPVTHIIGLVVAGVVLVVFSLCFLARMID